MREKSITAWLLVFVVASLTSCKSYRYSTYHQPNLYHKCAGLKQKMIFLQTMTGNNNLDQFHKRQRQHQLQRKFGSLHCQHVLDKK